MEPDRVGYEDPLDLSVKGESFEYSCKACVASSCTDPAIFSATDKISFSTMNQWKIEKTLTESHKL
jgi:hypothetical protein